MTNYLRLVSDDEVTRAAAIGAWLAGYPSATSRRSMESALRTVVRTACDLGREDPVEISTFRWGASRRRGMP